uniref:(northern house mosquito) hypothetical protein n=1 Tax=Culex pipiens TaxID=7175 RepID=A0A8D7ZYV5_CULPI
MYIPVLNQPSSLILNRHERQHPRDGQPRRVRAQFLLRRVQLRARGERVPHVVHHLAPQRPVARPPRQEDHAVLRQLPAGLAGRGQLLHPPQVRQGGAVPGVVPLPAAPLPGGLYLPGRQDDGHVAERHPAVGRPAADADDAPAARSGESRDVSRKMWHNRDG